MKKLVRFLLSARLVLQKVASERTNLSFWKSALNLFYLVCVCVSVFLMTSLLIIL